MKTAYSVTYTTYDPEAKAHRENKTWVSGARGQMLTDAGIERLLRKTLPTATVTRVEAWADAR